MKKILIILLSFTLAQQANAQKNCGADFKPAISFYQDGLAWIEPHAWSDIGPSIGTVSGMPVVSRNDMEAVLRSAWDPSQRCYSAACIKDLLGVASDWPGAEWSLVLFDNDDYNYMQAVTTSGISDNDYDIDDVDVNFTSSCCKVAHKQLHMQVRTNTIDRAHRRAMKMCIR
ncbi:MAG: hypothetical protein BGO69_09360 [Bacteroidetes bacterium 46-16]|nr:MAG: hypothetical protein BGO69_09360 [Bacteroidetes bacterium 46-16]